MPNLGPTELIIILVIIVAIFGAGKLADLGGALGRGVGDFRKAVKESNPDDENEEKSEPATKKRSAPAPEAEAVEPQSNELAGANTTEA